MYLPLLWKSYIFIILGRTELAWPVKDPRQNKTLSIPGDKNTIRERD